MAYVLVVCVCAACICVACTCEICTCDGIFLWGVCTCILGACAKNPRLTWILETTTRLVNFWRTLSFTLRVPQQASHIPRGLFLFYFFYGVQVASAKISAVDRLGMYVVVDMADGQSGKLRLPFPRAAESRKDVKTLIVEMTNAVMTATGK